MKASAGVISATLALSLAIWALFYLLTPGAPLTPPETLVLVGACGAVVLLGRRIWSLLRRARGGNADQS